MYTYIIIHTYILIIAECFIFALYIYIFSIEKAAFQERQ